MKRAAKEKVKPLPTASTTMPTIPSQRRLDFGTIQQCGRREELGILLDYVQRPERPASIWIEAEAGVGKSSLLQQFRESINESMCICIQGKFEERAAASEPFAALSEAMGELVDILRDSPSWSLSILQALDTEWPVLKGILPVLKPLVEEDRPQTAGDSPEDDLENATKDRYHEQDAFGDFSAKEWRFKRFRLAFRALIRHVCQRLETSGQQLILILDDLHWICPDSLQVFKTLLRDTRMPANFLLVAGARPLGVASEQYEQLFKFRESLLQSRTGKPLLKVISVTNLSVPEIKDRLLELLHKEKEQPSDSTLQELTELARIVRSKTNGNYFVVLQFLRLLERKGHLFFRDDRWQFDIPAIATIDPISDNVSQVVAHNLVESAQGCRRSALVVAASFGVSQFDVSTIVHAVSVLEEHNDPSPDENDYNCEEEDDPMVVSKRMNDMTLELSRAANEGIVEETSPGKYRFCHNSIRESAYSLLPPGDSRSEIHLKVGRQLRQWMDTSSELGLFQGFSKESLLLHAAKQSNLGANLIQDEWELLELAELNFQAAELAARKAAFFSSMEYLQVGLSYLGSTAWERHYDLTLKFTIALTRMQYSCGLLQECWATSEAVIQHGKTFADKDRMYHTRLLCLTQQERHDEALELALQVFEMLDKPWPRQHVVFHAWREHRKARRFLNETTDEELLNMPIQTDDHLDIYVDFVQKVAEIASSGGKLGYSLLSTCKAIGLIAEGQHYRRSFNSIVGWASTQTSFGDFEAGCQYGQLAKALAEKQRQSHPELIAIIDVSRCCFINPWQPEWSSRTDLASVEEAFRQLWVDGLVEVALVNASALLQHLFISGEALERVAFECDKYSEAFVDYQQMMHWHINAPIYQAVLCLVGSNHGNNNNPAVLRGEHILESEASFLDTCQKTGNMAATYQYQFWSMYLAYHFGDYSRAKSYLKSMRSALFEDGPGVLVTNRLFYTGLVYYALFKETGRGRYRRRALQAQRSLERWWNKGVGCCDYMCLLLQAEKLSCSRYTHMDRVVNAYDRAIQVVARSGLCHHHALAQELAGAFLFQKLQKLQLANCNSKQTPSLVPATKQYLSFAVQLYGERGAVAKVYDLHKRFSGLGLEEASGALGPLKGRTPVASRRAARGVESETETLEGSHFLGDSSSVQCHLLSSTNSRTAI